MKWSRKLKKLNELLSDYDDKEANKVHFSKETVEVLEDAHKLHMKFYRISDESIKIDGDRLIHTYKKKM